MSGRGCMLALTPALSPRRGGTAMNFSGSLRASRGVTAVGDSPPEPCGNLARLHVDDAENNSPSPWGRGPG